MRIIHAVDSSIQSFDGVATYINELILSSEARGDEVMLLCTTPTDKTNVRPIKYKGIVKAYKSLRFPGKPKFLYAIKPKIEKTINNFNPDLIWIHSIGPIGTKVAKIAKGKYKVICTKHSFDGELWCLYLKIPKPFQWIVHLFANWFEDKVADSCAFFVYHIHDTKKIEHKKYFNKLLKISPPIQSRFFENVTPKPLQPNKIALGFVADANPIKALKTLILG